MPFANNANEPSPESAAQRKHPDTSGEAEGDEDRLGTSTASCLACYQRRALVA